MNFNTIVNYNTKLSIKDYQIEHSANELILNRNCVVLEPSHKLGDDFHLITDDLCNARGMVRFEYKGWDDVIRRVEGHVCSILSQTKFAADVKIWTEKNEMVSIFFSSAWNMNVVQLPPTYTALEDNHEF